MNKKGSTETMSFLIGIIIFIMIIVPIGIVIYHYMQSQTGMERTLNLLVERTSELEDGQKGSVVGYIEKGYIMLGFEKDSTSFGSNDMHWSCDTGTSDYGKGDMLWNIRKPPKCGKRACLCACPITEGNVRKLDILPGDYLLRDACEEKSAVCKVYDEDKNPRFIGGADCEYGPFVTHDVPTLEINFERQGQTVGICEEAPCISKDVQKAREIYTSVYNAYMECKNNNLNDCICGTVDLAKLPSDNNIEFASDGSKTTIKLTDDDGPLRSKEEISPDLMGVYYPGTDTEKLVASFKTDKQPSPDEGFEDDVYMHFGDNGYYGTNGEIILYKSKAGNVNFVVEDRPIPKNKDYCRVLEMIKQEEANPAPEGSISIYYDEGNACSFGETTGGIATSGICRRECGENEYEIGRRGDSCEVLKCCGFSLDKGCADKGGACTEGSCEPSSQTEITGEDLCPAERPTCCMSGSPCKNIAKGECKGSCEERLNEEEAPGSYFTSPACGNGEKCCIEADVDLCVNMGGICQGTVCDLNSQMPFESTSSQLRCPRDKRFCCWPQSQCETNAGGACKSACEERLFEREASSSYFTGSACGSGMHCCMKTATESCTSKGNCQGQSCDLSKQTALTGLFCPEANPVCCKQGSQCEKMAGGICKSACEERLTEEPASGSLFTSLPCGSGEICCVKNIEPLGTG